MWGTQQATGRGRGKKSDLRLPQPPAALDSSPLPLRLFTLLPRTPFHVVGGVRSFIRAYTSSAAKTTIEASLNDCRGFMEGLSSLFSGTDEAAVLGGVFAGSFLQRFKSRRFRLFLLCEGCGQPCGDGYEIKVTSPAMVKLAPLLAVGLQYK